MSYHRFIGGPHDGETLHVRRNQGLWLPAIWTVAERPEIALRPSEVDCTEPQLSRRTDYKSFPLHIGKDEVVTLFIEHSMTPEEALLRLVACYRPTSAKNCGENG